EAERLRKEGRSFAPAPAPAPGSASSAASGPEEALAAGGPGTASGSGPAAAAGAAGSKPVQPGKAADGADLTKEITRNRWTRKYDWKVLAPLWFNADTGQSQYA